MRLTDAQRHVIRNAVLALAPSATVYLYGSRVHDQLRGGDIDLLVLSDALTLSDKLDLLVAMKLHLGDQRIDLVIHTAHSAPADPFVASVLAEAVAL